MILTDEELKHLILIVNLRAKKPHRVRADQCKEFYNTVSCGWLMENEIEMYIVQFGNSPGEIAPKNYMHMNKIDTLLDVGITRYNRSIKISPNEVSLKKKLMKKLYKNLYGSLDAGLQVSKFKAGSGAHQ